MNKNITINGVTYKIDNMDFGNFLCDMEERNIDTLDMLSGKTAHVFSFCRAFIDIVTGQDSLEASGKLLTKHIANGGKMDELLEVFPVLAMWIQRRRQQEKQMLKTLICRTAQQRQLSHQNNLITFYMGCGFLLHPLSENIVNL